MGFEEGAEGAGHESGCAEGVGQRRFEGGDFVFAPAVSEYQQDRRLPFRVIEGADLVAVLASR